MRHVNADPRCPNADRRDGPPPLAFEQVTFGYQRIPILREVNLRIDPAEFVAVVGPNGSGKSTLVKLGLGLLEPTHGTVRLFGESLPQFSDWARVGYVPQRASADAALPISVDEVVRSGVVSQVGLFGRMSTTQRERLEHAMDVMGIASLRKQAVAHLSGGQQQRVLIARALVTGPELLVLDEPTTGVDSDARRILREALDHLRECEGVAMVYITHDPEGFTGLADRVIEMRAGRAIEHRPDDPEIPGLGGHVPHLARAGEDEGGLG